MNKDIKETIQNRIEDIYQSGEYIYQAKELEEILNYITNLQEENQKLVKVISELEKHINEFPAISYASVEEVDGKRLSGLVIPKDYILNKLTELKGGSDEKVESEE